MKVRSVYSQAYIPRIAELVRGGDEELFGQYRCRAFIAAPPVASFVALYKEDDAAEKKAALKRADAGATPVNGRSLGWSLGR